MLYLIIDMFGGQNVCMFTGIKQCSRDPLNFTNVLCNRHAADVFSLKLKTCKLYGRQNETNRHLALSTSYPVGEDYPIIPLPIKLVDAANVQNGPFVHNNKKLCINTDVMHNVITTFLNKKDLINKGYSIEDIRKISNILNYFFGSGGVAPQNIMYGSSGIDSYAPQRYLSFQSTNLGPLGSYWNGKNTEKTSLGIVDEQGNIIPFPVYKLPLFIQALLVGFEHSAHIYTNNANLFLVPNVIADLGKSCIHLFNESADNIVYRDTEDADYTTPLVILGEVSHLTNSPYRPFQKQAVLPGAYLAISNPQYCAP